MYFTMRKVKPPRFCIASTGRSGSGYIAKVLQAYGLNVGHEQYWRFPWQQPKQVEGDSSWLSVPHLSDYEGIIFHQMRNPLHVLTSLMNTYGKDGSDYHKKKYFPYRKKLFKTETGDLMRDFMAHICWMNEEIEKHTKIRYKIEDLSVEEIIKIGKFIYVDGDYKKAREALQYVSSDYNKHHDTEYLTWNQIPDSKEKQQLKQQAQKYGYN